MPQKTNGHSANGCNGSGNGNSYDMEDGQTFLFTSESVGEGHPGESAFCPCSLNLCDCIRAISDCIIACMHGPCMCVMYTYMHKCWCAAVVVHGCVAAGVVPNLTEALLQRLWPCRSPCVRSLSSTSTFYLMLSAVCLPAEI